MFPAVNFVHPVNISSSNDRSRRNLANDRSVTCHRTFGTVCRMMLNYPSHMILSNVVSKLILHAVRLSPHLATAGASDSVSSDVVRLINCYIIIIIVGKTSRGRKVKTVKCPITPCGVQELPGRSPLRCSSGINCIGADVVRHCRCAGHYRVNCNYMY